MWVTGPECSTDSEVNQRLSRTMVPLGEQQITLDPHGELTAQITLDPHGNRAARKGEEGAKGAGVRSMRVIAQESKRGKEGNPQAR